MSQKALTYRQEKHRYSKDVLRNCALIVLLSIVLLSAWAGNKQDNQKEDIEREDKQYSDEQGSELIEKNYSDIENVLTVKSYEIGINYYDRKMREQVLKQNKLLDMKAVGMLVLKDDIDVELARKTIKSKKTLGIFRASHELKKL